MSKRNIQKQTIEKALFMYKETVSPSKSTLINILNQIPEKEKVSVPAFKRVTRSPYIWITTLPLVAFCSIMVIVFPSFQNINMHPNEPFYKIDNQVTQFETSIDAEDAQIIEQDYSL